MTDYRRSLIGLILLLLVQHAAIAVWFDITRPPVHDEDHFVPTIRQFADQFNLDTLRTYNEMNAPLPFVIYAAWGKAIGFQMTSLRLLSLLIALGTYVLIHRLIFTSFGSGRTALWTTVFIAAHPYMMSLSLLVYTDMLAIGFSAWACLALTRRKSVQIAVALACAMLCRQFASVYVVAFVVHLLFEWRWHRRADTVSMLIACAISLIPLAAMCVLWGGLSPDNVIRSRYLAYPATWQPASFVLYIALLSLYLLPLLILRWRTVFNRPQVVAWAIGLGALALFFPIRVSEVAKLHNATTVGFFATQLHYAFAHPLARDMVWMVLFIAGMIVLLDIVIRIIHSAANKSGVLFELIVLAFMIIMPLSYMRWEKYFMLIIPAACIAVLQLSSPTRRDVRI